MYKIAVIGGGAAGMMAAAAASDVPGTEVVLVEKNEKLGKKLYITGKGRCNLTNTMDTASCFSKIMRNPKFLYSAIYGFDHDNVMTFFEENGVPLKTERGGRVFPASDHASDITRALERHLRKNHVQIRLNCAVRKLLEKDGRITGFAAQDGTKEAFDALIVATGGLSYPQTGSTGDGYRFASETGHRVEPQRPSLVPMEARETWCRDLAGLSLRNVGVKLYAGETCIGETFGEMLFTHTGVSGPCILTLSALPSEAQIRDGLCLHTDLKPALDEKTLDHRLVKDFTKYANRQMHHAMKDLLPQRLIGVVLSQSAVDPEKRANTLTKEERRRILRTLKALKIHITGLGGFGEAVITRGGVSVKDLNASTMESGKLRGLYFAGEVIDTDALTGGFNLQIAWSTGHLAGVSAAQYVLSLQEETRNEDSR